MNIGVDIRCLMDRQRTGVGEYTYELLSAIFLQDKINQYYLFYNSNKDVSVNIPKWNQGNVYYVRTRYPNKVLNLLLFLNIIKLDKLVIKNLFKIQNSKFKIQFWFSPNLNFTNLSKKIKHIQTIHDLSFEIMPEWFTWKQRLWHWCLSPRRQCKLADLIITPSENTKRDIVSMWQIADNKVQVIYPGLSSIYNEQRTTNSEQNISFDLPKKYILYLGTLEPRKNVLSVIEAYKKNYELGIKNYELVIAGSSGWKNKEVFQAIQTTPGVKYVGYVSEEEKVKLYSGASLFVYPSLYEGFGLPVLEAMASGVPVITANRSSLSEVVGDSAYLVNPYNVSEISGAMREILENEELGEKIIEKQKIQVEKFSWERSAEEFLTMINQ